MDSYRPEHVTLFYGWKTPKSAELIICSLSAFLKIKIMQTIVFIDQRFSYK